jgi:hypothetical protein
MVSSAPGEHGLIVTLFRSELVVVMVTSHCLALLDLQYVCDSLGPVTARNYVYTHKTYFQLEVQVGRIFSLTAAQLFNY